MNKLFLLGLLASSIVRFCFGGDVPIVRDCILNLSTPNGVIGTFERVVWFAPDGISYILLDGNAHVVNGRKSYSLSLTPQVAGSYSFKPNEPLLPSTISSAALIPWNSNSPRDFVYELGVPNLWNHAGVSMTTSVDIDWPHVSQGGLNSSNSSYVTPGHPSTTGVVLSGPSRWVLIRAVSKTLKAYGVVSNVDSPSLKLYASDGSLLGTGSLWNATPDSIKVFTSLFKHVGAFQLAIESNEPVFIAKLSEGAYTVQVDSNINSGVILTEVYILPYTSGGL